MVRKIKNNIYYQINKNIASVNMNQINKTNVTMWKNRDAANDKKTKKTNSSLKNKSTNQKYEESSKIESDFIENLKKQIYFMEMELKLMKEREREIAKSGGFTQLFNDDKDPSTHIQQLKVKYANMRKKMEDQILLLNDKKREITGLNVSLKAKLASLQKLEQEVYNKLKNMENNKTNELNENNNNFEYLFFDYHPKNLLFLLSQILIYIFLLFDSEFVSGRGFEHIPNSYKNSFN